MLSNVIAGVACAVFLLLALWHVHMARRPILGVSGAVPSVGGRPLFVPSRKATLAIAFVLLLCAALVGGTAGFISVGLPQPALGWLSYALAVGLLARAVGEFRYVGFFKRVRDSEFAKLDTLAYSPLCLFLAAAVAFVASQNDY